MEVYSGTNAALLHLSDLSAPTSILQREVGDATRCDSAFLLEV